jgi:sugar lactone lactonase YvrE
MKLSFVVIVMSVFLIATGNLFAHPGSGIAVDREGNVYFVDTGSGIWKIDREGKLTKLSVPAYHWMAMDLSKRLVTVQLPRFTRGGAVVERDANDPRILVSSDFPITVGPDGSLYYPWMDGSEQLRIFQLSPSGKTTVAASPPPGAEGTSRRWLNGLVATPDGSLYYAEDKGIKRVTPRGTFTTVVADVTVSGCDSIPGAEPDLLPYLRGLDVDAHGTVYVAAAGCGAVLKITADKKVTTILRSSTPWSPTAVAVSGTDLYVLEYTHTPSDDRREWIPRVRKVSADGQVATVATVTR